MKRALVAGGAGFLGSHLCERLINDGLHVLCVDNFFTGSRENLRPIENHPRFEVLARDICEPIFAEVDEIYNFACPASPQHYQSDPIHTAKTSFLGSLNLLNLAQKCDCKIFQASTSEVYGDPLVHPQKEDYWGHVNPVGIRACYDEGKRCAETLFFDFHRRYNIKIKVARIFNTYGPRMHPNDGRVVSNFIVQALKNEPLTVYGSGKQTRSFCYVDDLIEGTFSLMRSADEITGPFNLGNPLELPVIDLAKKTLELADSSSPIEYLPLPSDDPKQRRPDIQSAEKHLKWTPKVPLKEGLESTIAYFRKKLSREQERIVL